LANITVGEFAARQREVLTRSHLDVALIVKEDATLRQGIDVMLRQNSHRLLVVDANNVLTTIVSQSRFVFVFVFVCLFFFFRNFISLFIIIIIIIRILELCFELIKSHPCGPRKLSELKIGSSDSELKFVQESDSAYMAFKLMVSAGLSSVPVL